MPRHLLAGSVDDFSGRNQNCYFPELDDDECFADLVERDPRYSCLSDRGKKETALQLQRDYYKEMDELDAWMREKLARVNLK